MLNGIDVSEYQGNIDWQLVATQTDFAVIRCSIYSSRYAANNYLDHRFEQNWQAAKQTNLKLSAYYVFKPDVTVQNQINAFLRGIDGKQNDLEWVFDVELDAGLSKEQITERLWECLEYFEDETGQQPIIYTGAWFWNPRILRSPLWQNYKLWTAAYTQNPIIPFDWNDWYIWQYTSSGSINGISGNVDLNRGKLVFEQTGYTLTLQDNCEVYNNLGIDAEVTGTISSGTQVNFEAGYIKTTNGGYIKL